VTSTGASPDRVAQLEDAATAGARRLGNPHVEADLLNARGYLHFVRGDNATARRLFEQADAAYLAASLAAEPFHISVLQNLGAVCVELGDLACGDRALDRAVALARQRYGDAPLYWETVSARATVDLARKELAKAEAELRDAVAGFARDPTATYQLGMTYSYLCATYHLEVKDDDARAACASAIAAMTKTFGDDGAALVFPLELAGQIELAAHAPATALAHLRRATELARAANVRPIELTTAEAYLAIALLETHQRAEARALAAKVAPALRETGLEEARADFVRAFPELRAAASGQ